MTSDELIYPLTETPQAQSNIAAFFDYAVERQSIFLKRSEGLSPPWSNDIIFQTYRFCNVFREDDKTTQWFIKNVLNKHPAINALLASVTFRWFNRMKTGSALFLEPDLFSKKVPFDFMLTKDPFWILHALDNIKQVCGKGPYITGAYIIKTPDGMDKVNGVLWCLDKFLTEKRYDEDKILRSWQDQSYGLNNGHIKQLHFLWKWLKKYPYLGDFMSYEIVTDLSYVFNFYDVNQWANPGPGATRGLGRIIKNDKDAFSPKKKTLLIKLMQHILSLSRSRQYWPREWKMWNMRTVEHTLCEYDKYQRVLRGEGKPKQRFKPII